ncbi:hypothetical protein DSTSK_21070 [Desulforhabdus sp. TSK]|nr:hypothetical protein DSTSK_21070 [Desulforhabdus sp. TSK]
MRDNVIPAFNAMDWNIGRNRFGELQIARTRCSKRISGDNVKPSGQQCACRQRRFSSTLAMTCNVYR